MFSVFFILSFSELQNLYSSKLKIYILNIAIFNFSELIAELYFYVTFLICENLSDSVNIK